MWEARDVSETEILLCKAPGRDVDNIAVVEYDRVKDIISRYFRCGIAERTVRGK
ncbi:hypothetical protein SCP_0400330 [Sparassis crispa]|uniref:Uncharacterized protein n=1 Tax=Sparassis crispa TaxID=139825 RepID=A0A401GHL7_9APHY|nr:hypothetical protein SCP_0400330 [Sparassis crispa]GBE81662.1 hypothetical protein SCP_0400330 [Sparassis crispa]